MRIHKAKARKQYPCRKCSDPIEAGQEYLWYKHRYRPKVKFHTKHGYPRPSELTTSDKLFELYGAREALEDAISEIQGQGFEPEVPENQEMDDGDILLELLDRINAALDDLGAAVDEAVETAGSVADGYEESADNVEEYFGETEQVSNMRDNADQIREWIDALESVDLSDRPSAAQGEDLETSISVAQEFIESKIEELEGAIGELNL